MKLPNTDIAKLVRDAGIEAMEALNTILTDTTPYISAEEGKEVRLAVAKAISSILDNIVNPVLRDYPELDVDEDLWGEIAAARARSRLASKA